MRNAKIVCTIGPATASLENMRKLVDAGMDVARINRSHGSTEEHEQVYRNVRQAADEAGRNVAVLVDLQGPKIRLEKFADGPHDLAVGDVFTITNRDVVGTKDICGTTYKGLPGDCNIGDALLIDDGKVRLEVTVGDRHRCGDQGGRSRPRVQQQGHQPSRRRRVGSRPVRKGRG